VKSIGHELTFLQDIISLDVAKKELLALGNKVARRMRHKGLKGKIIKLKVKYSDFVQITRSTTLPKSTDDGSEIYSVACRLLKKTEATKKQSGFWGFLCLNSVLWVLKPSSLFLIKTSHLVNVRD
jgi:DNA polymerase-4